MISLDFLRPILHPKLCVGCKKKRILGFKRFSKLKLFEYQFKNVYTQLINL